MSNKLWGARFKKKTDKDFEEFSKSIEYDYKLAEYDILHSLIHVEALAEEKIITKKEKERFILALENILLSAKRGKFKFDITSEDIHTDIQNKVEKKVGKLAYKFHTFRSRNEQIAFDEKFYCVEEATAISFLIESILDSLSYLSYKYKNKFFPGYTHTQRAQVVNFSDYLGAYSAMFKRDREKLKHFIKNTILYVKSGALAGSFIKRSSYIKAIKKVVVKYRIKNVNIQVVSNPLDNVASRDFIVELLSILSLIQMHLSRMAEDFILYSTREFSFFSLPEEFCTGSSLMPHKKNPDFLELVRGYTGKIYGNMVSLLVTMKGLPLTYNRDMQLDKEPIFSSVKIIKDELKIMAKLIRGIKLNLSTTEKVLGDDSFYATELARFLVYKGVPFKEAHNIVGRMLKYCEDKMVSLKDMSENVLKGFHTSLTPAVIKEIITAKSYR